MRGTNRLRLRPPYRHEPTGALHISGVDRNQRINPPACDQRLRDSQPLLRTQNADDHPAIIDAVRLVDSSADSLQSRPGLHRLAKTDPPFALPQPFRGNESDLLTQGNDLIGFRA
jgi:hypothetical protein